jgi:hypothetical protein
VTAMPALKRQTVRACRKHFQEGSAVQRTSPGNVFDNWAAELSGAAHALAEQFLNQPNEAVGIERLKAENDIHP